MDGRAAVRVPRPSAKLLADLVIPTVHTVVRLVQRAVG